MSDTKWTPRQVCCFWLSDLHSDLFVMTSAFAWYIVYSFMLLNVKTLGTVNPQKVSTYKSFYMTHQNIFLSLKLLSDFPKLLRTGYFLLCSIVFLVLITGARETTTLVEVKLNYKILRINLLIFMYKLKLAFYEGTIWYETIVLSVCMNAHWLHFWTCSLTPLWKNYKW